MKKLCERHLTSLCHANVQCINLRIEIIFSQNLRILMVKTDVKDKFSHFFGCLYGGDAKDSGTSACACGLFSSATTFILLTATQFQFSFLLISIKMTVSVLILRKIRRCKRKRKYACAASFPRVHGGRLKIQSKNFMFIAYFVNRSLLLGKSR